MIYCRQKIVSMQFMRKYIHVAKALKPNLTQPAAELLAEEYSKLRSHDSMTQDNVARVSRAVTMETRKHQFLKKEKEEMKTFAFKRSHPYNLFVGIA